MSLNDDDQEWLHEQAQRPIRPLGVLLAVLTLAIISGLIGAAVVLLFTCDY